MLALPVSPIVPVQLCGCGLFLLSWYHYERFTLGCKYRPQVETALLDRYLGNTFQRCVHRIERHLVCPSGPKNCPGVSYAMLLSCALMVFVIVFAGKRLAHGLEPMPFDILFEVYESILAVFTAVTFVRFLSGWSVLKEFLAALNSIVLGRFVERLPECGGQGPIWMRKFRKLTLSTLIDSSIALHNLDRTGFLQKCYAPNFSARLHKLLEVNGNACDPAVANANCAYKALQWKANMISGELLSTVLLPYWMSHELPFVGAPLSALSVSLASASKTQVTAPQPALAMSATTSGPGSLSFNSAATSTLAVLIPAAAVCPKGDAVRAYEFASRFIALQYSTFIAHTLSQLQNFLLCSAVCFALAVLAMNSFAFLTSHAVINLAAAALGVAGVLTLKVLAQMERDPILSRLSGTHEGELGKDFYLRAITFGALPVLSVLSAYFPDAIGSLAGWIEPAISKMH